MIELHITEENAPAKILALIRAAPEYEAPLVVLDLMEDWRDELIPLFQSETDRALELSKKGELQENGDWKVPGFALAFLSEWKTPGTHHRLLEVLKLNDEDRDWLIADALTEDWPQLLAATFEGDLQPITQVVLDQSLDEFARAMPVEAVAALAHHGALPQEEAEAWFSSLFEQLEREPCYVWDKLVSVVADLRMTTLLPKISQAFKDHLCDENCGWSLADLKKVMAGRNPWESLGMIYEISLPKPEVNAREMICNWPSFQKKWRAPSVSAAEDGSVDGGDVWLSGMSDFEMEALARPAAKPKIGRNEPCPCGSGKKFKKCCGGV